ncbi:response regulator transcription factor [Vibrio sp. Isolate25]|uniref:response regulator transcription factor n=1 Tax=unclassified Vibrio TaxID=2614977 RepID=UPI001EFD7E9C|nr:MULTISPECIES: response regulator transcription factor [unclassified Vibrio]MCG9595910.1 response regulator transcription factor [Vibrio sp. Isolate25]MCG9677405.1 response regulator transcription factor [Vibrio sp. Isolate24]MCG9682160.1 response regulator transcription factor [Vibrio sp. Isolate23]
MIHTILVEDDTRLAGNIIDFLELENITCDFASNGITALNLIENNDYQVIILDINLPRLDGFSVCEQLRSQGIGVPIIMLTARSQLEDKLTGFKVGTDDYLVKPFAMAELVARTKALVNRKSGQLTQFKAGNIMFNSQEKQAYVDNQPLKLPPTSLTILEQLMRAYPHSVTRQSLNLAIWDDRLPNSDSLKVHIHHLRKALACHNSSASIISINRQGFKLQITELETP